MKQQCRALFSFILSPMESGTAPYAYKRSHRVALLVLSLLFTFLASVVFFIGQGEDPTYLIPVMLFGGVGFLGIIIGSLGTERAVAKIWGTKP